MSYRTAAGLAGLPPTVNLNQDHPKTPCQAALTSSGSLTRIGLFGCIVQFE